MLAAIFAIVIIFTFVLVIYHISTFGGGGGNGVVTSLIARLSVSLYTEIRKVS